MGQSGMPGEHRDLTSGEGAEGRVGGEACCSPYLAGFITLPARAAACSLEVREASSIAVLGPAGRDGAMSGLAEGTSR